MLANVKWSNVRKSALIALGGAAVCFVTQFSSGRQSAERMDQVASVGGVMLDMTITGFEKLDKALLELEPKLAKKVLTKSMRDALKPVKKRVEQNEPKGEGPGEHGSLKKTKIKAGPRRKYSYSLEIQLGDVDDVYWAPMVEYGTSTQPAQHTMLKAFDETKAKALDDLATAILKGLEKLVAEAPK
jgi:HK97 gp10 family phage protein